jgi:hypothetical protein
MAGPALLFEEEISESDVKVLGHFHFYVCAVLLMNVFHLN